MSEQRDQQDQQILESMSLMEKVGQLLTFTWRGAISTPSSIEQITKLHAGGLCLEPYGLARNPQEPLLGQLPVRPYVRQATGSEQARDHKSHRQGQARWGGG